MNSSTGDLEQTASAARMDKQNKEIALLDAKTKKEEVEAKTKENVAMAHSILSVAQDKKAGLQERLKMLDKDCEGLVDLENNARERQLAHNNNAHNFMGEAAYNIKEAEACEQKARQAEEEGKGSSGFLSQRDAALSRAEKFREMAAKAEEMARIEGDILEACLEQEKENKKEYEKTLDNWREACEEVKRAEDELKQAEKEQQEKTTEANEKYEIAKAAYEDATEMADKTERNCNTGIDIISFYHRWDNDR